MTASACAALLDDLSRDGVHLWIEAGQLRYRAPRGVLTDARKASLSALKQEVIACLQARGDEALALPEVPGAEAVWLPADTQLYMAINPDTGNIDCSQGWPGLFDPAALDVAVEALLRRHSNLRTRYIKDDRYQLIAVTDRLAHTSIPLIDLRHLPARARETEALAAHASLVWQPFDLQSGPLFRFAVLRLTDDATVIVFSVHHSICDGISQRTLCTELTALYRAAVTAKPVQLEALPMEYRDFARHQREWLESAEAQPHVDFWRNVLGESHSLFWLPADRRSPVGDTRGLPDVCGEISGDVLTAVRDLAKREQCTTFAVATAAFMTVLAQWSGREDVATWICHVGRSHAGLYGLVGCFASFWLLRIDLPEDVTFVETLRRVQKAYLEALPHMEVTVRKIVPDIERTGPILPAIAFNYIPLIGPSGATEGSRKPAPAEVQPAVRPLGRFTEGSPLALVVTAAETEDTLKWTIRHSSYLFEEATIERFSAGFAKVLINAGRPRPKALRLKVRQS